MAETPKPMDPERAASIRREMDLVERAHGEAQPILAEIRKVVRERLGDAGGGMDLVSDIDRALGRLKTREQELAELRARVARLEQERDDARIHELNARAALDYGRDNVTRELLRHMAEARGWGYLYPESGGARVDIATVVQGRPRMAGGMGGGFAEALERAFAKSEGGQ